MTIPINFSLLLPGLNQIYSDIRSFYSDPKNTVSSPADNSSVVPSQNAQKNEYVQADWLTPEQKTAYQSGDQDAIRLADEAALNQAIARSKASLVYEVVRNNSSDMPGNPALATEGDLNQHRAATHSNTGKLKSWFEARGFEVVRTSGSQFNCAIHSLLKLATGNFVESHLEPARYYKDWLVSKFKDSQLETDKVETSGTMLLADSAHMKALVNKINEDYNANMRVSFVMGDAEGRPFITHSVGDGDNNVVIFDQGGHFEPVIAGEDISFLSSPARVIAV